MALDAEVVQTVQGYLTSSDAKTLSFGPAEDAQLIAAFIAHGIIVNDEDAPDIVMQHEGMTLLVEHFEFDCYKNTRKGSENKREQARIDRQFQEIAASQQSTYLHDVISGESSYEHYLKNVTTAFNTHYQKLPSYTNKVIERGWGIKGSSLKTLFLIEDTSPLGCIAYASRGSWDTSPHPIVLALSPEFLEIMKSCSGLDYVLACSSYGNEKYVWLIALQHLDEYLENTEDYASMQFLSFTPQVISATVEVTKEAIDTAQY